MGLTDFAVKVMTYYKADISDQRAKVRELRGEQKKAAQAVLLEMEAQNRSIDAQTKKWVGIGVAIGGAFAAFKVAQKAANSYLEDMRLESAAAGINIDKLALATRGLVEQDKLLEFAGKAQNGVWKLNQKEMETVAKGTDVLAKRMGIDLQTAMDAVTESVTKGTTRSLKELGLEVKNETEFMAAMSDAAKGAGSAATSAAEQYQQAAVRWKDAIDNLMGALGELAIALTPVMEILGQSVSGLADLIKGLKGLASGSGSGEKNRAAYDALQRGDYETFKRLSETQIDHFSNLPMFTEYAKIGAEGVRQEKAAKEIDKLTAGITDAIGEHALKVADKAGADVKFWLDAAARKAREGKAESAASQRAREKTEKLIREIDEIQADIFELKVQLFTDTLKEQFDAKTAKIEAMGAAGLESFARTKEAAAGRQDREDARGVMAGYETQKIAEWEADRERNSGKSRLAQVIGTPAEIDEQRLALIQLSTAFDGFTMAATAGFDAWITGADSIGGAFKKGVAEALRALAGQMFVESLKHAAFALGSLAFLDFRGAGQHAVAAAAFGAGAVGAGIVARELGGQTGQWSGGGGRSAGYSGSSGRASNVLGSGSGGGDVSGTHITVILGNDAYDMTPAERRVRLARAVRMGDMRRTKNVIDHS